MASAYTPGLTVSADTLILRRRRLPLKGDVVVQAGERVEPDTVVARTLIPGVMRTVKVAETLGLEPHEVPGSLLIRQGDEVTAGQAIAQTRSFFGLFRSECRASATGAVELVSATSGHIGIREAPTPVEVRAYVRGSVTEVLTGEGVAIETRGALVQGIFGVGGERQGVLQVVSAEDEPVREEMIAPEHAGRILVGGGQVSGAALRRAAEVGVAGIVVAAIVDEDLIDFLGYDIGVAITGHEAIDLTLIITEGFGSIRMAERTYRLLRSLEGQQASINGATQIRAGVIRPEVIVPESGVQAFGRSGVQELSGAPERLSLDIGTPIRLIREPYFGRLAHVAALPPEPQAVPSGAVVRVLEAVLQDGQQVTVPRANVEIITA